MNNINNLPLQKLLKSFFDAPEYSVKWRNYFDIYSLLFSNFIDKKITFVEIGVLHGGSLFMWRSFFGPNARIIGIDLNPEALKWKDFGFEIYIGDQANPEFWENFFEQVGDVDVILDDGGHSNIQQIQTIKSTIKHIKDGGVIVIEDTQTSYQRDFGNPSSYSGVEFAKQYIDAIASRNPELDKDEPSFSRNVQSIRFFESIIAFYIDSNLSIVNSVIDNGRARSSVSDFRYFNDGHFERLVRNLIKKFGYRMQSRGKSYIVSKIFNLTLMLVQSGLYLVLKLIISSRFWRIRF